MAGWVFWLITACEKLDVLKVRVRDQTHLFASQGIPRDSLLQASGFLNKDSG